MISLLCASRRSLLCASRRSLRVQRIASAPAGKAAWQDDFTRLPYTPQVGRIRLWQSPAVPEMQALPLLPPPTETLFRLDQMDEAGGFSLTLWADAGV